MKSTIAPRTAVFLAIATASCGTAVAILNVRVTLKDLGWSVMPLFIISGFFFLLAVWTAFRPNRHEAQVDKVMRVMASHGGNPIGLEEVYQKAKVDLKLLLEMQKAGLLHIKGQYIVPGEHKRIARFGD